MTIGATTHAMSNSETDKFAFDCERWIKRPQPNPRARLRLFCFPYAGGAASIFRRWPDYLARDIEVCSVQLPGRENRIGERLYTRLDLLVDRLVDTLISLMDRPFGFYGHSMGTLVAFELARELRRRGLDGPVHLLVSGRCAPQIPDPEPSLHALPEAAFIDGLRRYNGTSEAVLNNKELMEMLEPLLRADFELCETYTYEHETPLDCPISAYAGQDEPCSAMMDGWREQTSNVFETKLFPGGHFFINHEMPRFVQVISERLSPGC